MKPKLTLSRWLTLKKLAQVQDRVFTAGQVNIHGASFHSVEKCGWIERSEPPADSPFEIATRGHHWRVTQTGREAIAALPETPPRRT